MQSDECLSIEIHYVDHLYIYKKEEALVQIPEVLHF